MKLVTLFKKSIEMPAEYVPGKCNIGARGRAIRLATGLGIIAIFAGVGVLALGSVSPIPSGMAFGKSKTKMAVESEEWKKLDRHKGRVMHLEAVLGALVLAGLLALA